MFLEISEKIGHNARNVLVEAPKILYKDYFKFDENNKGGEDRLKINKGGQLIKKGKKDKKGCC